MYNIYFSKYFQKLKKIKFVDIRRSDKYHQGKTYNIFLKRNFDTQFLFAAKLYKKEKMKLSEIDDEILMEATDCSSRSAAIRALNLLFYSEIREDELLTLIFFDKNHAGQDEYLINPQMIQVEI